MGPGDGDERAFGRAWILDQHIDREIQFLLENGFDAGAVQQADGARRLDQQVDVATMARVVHARSIQPDARIRPGDEARGIDDRVDLFSGQAHGVLKVGPARIRRSCRDILKSQ